MSPERWQRLEEVYLRASEFEDEAARDAYLAHACAGDDGLLDEVRAMIAQPVSKTLRIDRPAWELAGSLLKDEVSSAEVAEENLRPGAMIGHYRVDTLLGAGGMGRVYRATDSRLGRSVAIKFLMMSGASSFARRRFELEARTTSSLNHPHILTVYEAGEIGSRQYLVSEYVDGGTLDGWIEQRKPRWRQCLQLLVGVADGLACAHAAGVLHRDIKPDNILVSANGYAKLADFGLAKLFDPIEAAGQAESRATKPGTILGTIPGTLSSFETRAKGTSYLSLQFCRQR
jgi:eukaryotic-like serine/threonine-protein kinase